MRLFYHPKLFKKILLSIFILQLTACVFSGPTTITNSQPDVKSTKRQTIANSTEKVDQSQVTQEIISSTQPNTVSTLDYGSNYKAIQLAWFYKPPSSGDLNTLEKNYSSYVLTRMDERERDTLQVLGVKAPILQYLVFGTVQNPGSCTKTPLHNQVTEKPGDFCMLTEQHPDWFLQDISNKNIANGNGYFLMDPGKNAWRDFFLERVRISQEKLGWQGVFLDNVEANLEKRIQNGGVPKNYLDDASYQAVIEDNLRYLYINYFKPNNRPLYANIISLKSDPSIWFRYIQYLDGAMIEDFAVGWHDDEFKDPSRWEMQMEIAEKTQGLGKTVILVSQGSEFDHIRQVFALASYLLVNNGKAYFRYTSQYSYDQIWTYDNYSIELGKPLGTRYEVDDTWVRDFEKGKVIVNPKTNKASITIQ